MPGCRETAVLPGKLETVHNRAIEDRHCVAAARTVEMQARRAGRRQGRSARMMTNADKMSSS